MMAAKFRIAFQRLDPDRTWKNPLNLSIGFHVLVLAFTTLLPVLFEHKPLLPEIYTVNLYNASEIPDAAPTALPASHKPATPPAKESTSALVVSEQKISSVQSEPAPVISLAPVKRKVRKAKPEAGRNMEKARQALLQERRKAEQVLQQSREKASQAAVEAVDLLRKALQTNTSVRQNQGSSMEDLPADGPAAASGSSGGIEVDLMMKQYYAAVYQRIQSHWFLPPLQDWDKDLEAIMVIRVQKNGRISRMFFEKKSNNIYFNQFLDKTVRDSEPLPPLPEKLNEQSLEVGLRFTPAGVQ
jgi:hypothetical protein